MSLYNARKRKLKCLYQLIMSEYIIVFVVQYYIAFRLKILCGTRVI